MIPTIKYIDSRYSTERKASQATQLPCTGTFYTLQQQQSPPLDVNHRLSSSNLTPTGNNNTRIIKLPETIIIKTEKPDDYTTATLTASQFQRPQKTILTGNIMIPNGTFMNNVLQPGNIIIKTEKPDNYKFLPTMNNNFPNINNPVMNLSNISNCTNVKIEPRRYDDLLLPKDCIFPDDVLNTFQQELVKLLEGPQNRYPPIDNIIDLPQHLEVKLKLITKDEYIKEIAKKQQNSLISKLRQQQHQQQQQQQEQEQEPPVKYSKSTQCLIYKFPPKSKKEDIKKKSEMTKNSDPKMLEKSISTEDYDIEFESHILYVPTKNVERYKYLKDGYVECLKCRKICKSVGSFLRHSQQHEEKSLLCDICGKIMSRKLICSHPKVCRARAYENISSSSLDTSDIWKCRHCGKLSNTWKNHTKHLKIHYVYICSCGEQFRNKSDIVDHCTLKNCKNLKGYRKRLPVDKRIKVNEVKPKRRIYDPDRYLCKVCNLRCHDYTQFRYHRLKHITERNFHCKTCNNRYRTLQSLKSHIKNKHLLLSQCEICGKNICTAAMAVHLRRHTGERPYVCKICDKGFIAKRSLREHQFHEHNIGSIPELGKTSIYQCYLCNNIMRTTVRAFHTHLKKIDHILKEEKWKEKFSITQFKCENCYESFPHFADYAEHVSKRHKVHYYWRMKEFFKICENEICENAKELICDLDEGNAREDEGSFGIDEENMGKDEEDLENEEEGLEMVDDENLGKVEENFEMDEESLEIHEENPEMDEENLGNVEENYEMIEENLEIIKIEENPEMDEENLEKLEENSEMVEENLEKIKVEENPEMDEENLGKLEENYEMVEENLEKIKVEENPEMDEENLRKLEENSEIDEENHEMNDDNLGKVEEDPEMDEENFEKNEKNTGNLKTNDLEHNFPTENDEIIEKIEAQELTLEVDEFINKIANNIEENHIDFGSIYDDLLNSHHKDSTVNKDNFF